jgi:hypothetical protein
MSVRRFSLIKSRSQEEFREYAKDLFCHILEYSSWNYDTNNPLWLIKEADILDELITHFEKLEEFEKCIVLIKVKRYLYNI